MRAPEAQPAALRDRHRTLPTPPPPVPGSRRQRGWIAALAVLLALGFLGNRGIWDPDEGRYTNVALTMLDTGDWLTPQRNREVGHWTKPPLTYWAIAGSVAVFGHNPAAARLPTALAYLFCVWMAWRCARRLAPGTQATAAIVYATMLLPFGAANYVTADYLLAAAEALAVYAFIEARFGAPGRAGRWLARRMVWLAAGVLAHPAAGNPALDAGAGALGARSSGAPA